MNTTNNKQIALDISDAAAELTLAQIIANTCDRNTFPRARSRAANLQGAYREFIFGLADNALLNAIVFHCELNETPPTPEQVQDMALQIYKDYIAPPVWSWAGNLCANLKDRVANRAQALQILAALGVKEYYDLRGIKYPLPETPATTYTAPKPEPTPINWNTRTINT